MPFGAHFLSDRSKPAPEFFEAASEISGCATLADMRVPAADIEKPDVELVTHQFANAACFELEAFGADRIVARSFHLRRHRVHHLVTHAEAFVDLRRERRAPIHRCNDGTLPVVEAGFADRAQRHVGNILLSPQYNRQLIGERDRLRASEHADQPVEEP